jgi:exosortase
MKKMARKSKKVAVANWKFAVVSALLLVFFTLLIYYKTFSSLKLYIDDTDPYSYRAVIPPMFLITLIFFYRDDLKVDKDAKKFLLAVPFFVISVVLLLKADTFSSYSLDALSLPFFIAGCILLFFSISAMRRLLFLILYLFLLWTPLLQPIISTQQSLTNFTSDVVGFPINLFGFPIQRDGNIFYSSSNITLEVVPECVSLSSIIALFCFLLPFAYVARGKIINKIAWLAVWVIGGWVLDVMRITAVLIIWYYSGVSTALQVFHSLGWNILFDLTLIGALGSLLFFKLFGLEFKL